MKIEEYNSLQRKRDTPLERTSVCLCYILTYKFGNIGLRVGIASPLIQIRILTEN